VGTLVLSRGLNCQGVKEIAPSSDEFKNDWSHISTPSVSFDGVYGDFFIHLCERRNSRIIRDVDKIRVLRSERGGYKKKPTFVACINRLAAER